MSEHSRFRLLSLGRFVTAAAVVISSSTVALGLTLSEPGIARAVDGVSLTPAAGQFVPVDGTLIASLSSGLLNGSNATATTVNVGTTYHVNLAQAGVPSDATSVALEFI